MSAGAPADDDPFAARTRPGSSASSDESGTATDGPAAIGAADDGAGLIAALQHWLGESGELAAASKATVGSLARLASAEWALARSAAVRGIVVAAVAWVVAWVALQLVLATVVSLLVAAGLSWPAALGLCSLLALLGLALLVRQVLRMFGLVGMTRTRQRIGELRGLFG